MIDTNIDVFHGHISKPESRASIACREGKIMCWEREGLEYGKFFPATRGGLLDSFAPSDVRNNTPPADGKIASAHWVGGEILDEPGTHWPTNQVKSGETIDFTWTYTAVHKTRRWNYFITKQDWDPNQKLSRASFEEKPFAVVQLEAVPFWSHTKELTPEDPTIHSITLPNRSEYQVLLGVWEVADTGNAFYQVVDLNFIN